MSKVGKASSGFTLIELMMVVAILGILAAVAIPAFSQYIQDSKKGEASTNLRIIADGALAYYHAEQNEFGQIVTGQFPPYVDACSAGADPSGGKVAPDSTTWTDPVWKDLKFDITKPHYFSYCYSTNGTQSAFAARADAALSEAPLDTRLCVMGWGNLAEGSVFITNIIEIDPSTPCSP
ncbi:MAG: prepilin-type N-terminal cleavage/methylation domain-containing protein [Myxococcota bacterium]|jgi:prepilin-type N-terminal cleavage/methylation domain-containing protein|nr:prepilin-type N-terminal cleavage/methylation domain-containing protein [Myxococcota bacterium]